VVILKTYDEIRHIKEACFIVAGILEEFKTMAVPGATSLSLNQFAKELIDLCEAIPAFLGYKGFPWVICASINNEIVHGFPRAEKLVEGDILSLDVGVELGGWFGDAAITIPIGKVSKTAEKLITTTEECLHKGIEKAVPGGRLGDISNAIQQHAELAGFNVVRDYVGHGIGKNLHENPQIKNYGNKGEGILLKPGMVIAIEPMLVEKSYKTKKLKNNWTVVTEDGGLAAHFEHTVAITDNGAEILTEM
jgi:methionyl aminopeptidase